MSRATGVSLFVRTVLARAYPRVVGTLRQPSWILSETALPIVSVAAFAYVYRALGAPDRYIGFVILGGAMTAFWLNVLWSMGAQLYWERDSGNLELYVLAPGPLTAVLAGMALGGMIMTVVRAAVIVLAGVFLFHVRFDLTHWPAVLGVFALTMLSLYGLGMVFSSVFLMWGREAWHIVNLLQEPVYVASGTNFPISTLPTVVATLAALLPLTTGMDAMRQLLFPLGDTGEVLAEGFLPVGVEAGLLAVLAVVFISVARGLLAYVERKAREEGRLTVRWQ